MTTAEAIRATWGAFNGQCEHNGSVCDGQCGLQGEVCETVKCPKYDPETDHCSAPCPDFSCSAEKCPLLPDEVRAILEVRDDI